MASRGGRAIAVQADTVRRLARSGTVPAVGTWFSAAIATEWDRGRAALWLAVAFAAGILAYGTAAHTPSPWAGPAVAILALAAAYRLRHSLAGLALASSLTALALGFSAATLQEVSSTDAPILSRTTRAEATGRVEVIEPRLKDRRLYLSLDKLGELAPAGMPKRVRVIVPKAPALAPGDLVTLTATWQAPPGPLRPGGYDSARAAFAQEIGAYGARAENLKRVGGDDRGLWAALPAAIQRLRLDLTDRIAASAGGTAGPIAAALVTGVRTAIPTAAEDEMRAAGLSHVLSISGMHLALVAAVLFGGTRALLALSPGLALRRPIKCWAALVALAGSAFYLVLSGAEVATQRSFVMATIVLLAVAAGRPALTMRNVALAALLVLAVSPQSLFGASFQMSFGAVLAIVAGFEFARPPALTEGTGRFALARAWLLRGLLAMAATTLLAGLATAPFAAFHFHQLTPYSLLGNLLALPIVSFWIMPAGVLGAVLIPFGLDAWVWPIMGAGIDAMLGIAGFVAALPGAERPIPAFGAPALLCFVAALLVGTLCVSGLRFAAVPLAAAGLVFAATERQPDIYVDQTGRALAVRGPDGRLDVAGARFASLATKSWLEADGDDPRRRSKPGPGVLCDEIGCTAKLADGRSVALVWDVAAFGEDCRRAAIVVTRLKPPKGCDRFAAVIDRSMLAVTGSLALYRDADSFRLVAARAPGADRAWFNRSAEARAAATSIRRY
jgi:competence protein ComEC